VVGVAGAERKRRRAGASRKLSCNHNRERPTPIPTKISKTTPCKVAGPSSARMLRMMPRHLTCRANHRHNSIMVPAASRLMGA